MNEGCYYKKLRIKFGMQRIFDNSCQTLQYRTQMKQNIYLSALIFSILISVGCHRTKSVDEKKVYSNSLQGDWELRNVFGGFGPPGRPTNFPAGNGHIRSFKDSTFKYYADGKLVDSGTFALTRDTCPATQTLMDAFILSNSYGHKIFFEISKDTLTLYNGVIAADGTIEKYVRINNTD